MKNICLALLVVVAVTLSAEISSAVPFDINDPNTWATAAILSQSGGPDADTYTQTWQFQWSTEAGAAAGLATYRIVGFEWQPDGNGTTADSDAGPAGWAYLASGGGFIGNYANGTGASGSADATSYGLGLGYQVGALGPYAYIFTTTGALNAMNYHLQFAHPEETGQGTHYVWNQNSLTAGDGEEVPEPSSLLLLGSGLLGLGVWARKRRQ